MKPLTRLLAAPLVLAASTATAQQQAPGGADALTELRKGFATVSAWITGAADAVPADQYSFKPVATVRTFGQLVAHVADEYNYYCPLAGGRNVEWTDATEKGPTDKATVVAKLRQATAACTTAYHGTPPVRPVISNNADAFLHYGNIATYLRLMGMVPPSSR